MLWQTSALLSQGIRCIDGRLWRHDPQADDPYLETDVGACEGCRSCRGMRAVVQRDEVGGSYDRDHAWIATEHGVDLDVAIGHGATPLRAVEDLLWCLDREGDDPEEVEIVWD